MQTNIDPYDTQVTPPQEDAPPISKSQSLVKFCVFTFLACSLIISLIVIVLGIAAVAWPILSLN